MLWEKRQVMIAPTVIHLLMCQTIMLRKSQPNKTTKTAPLSLSNDLSMTPLTAGTHRYCFAVPEGQKISIAIKSRSRKGFKNAGSKS